MPNMRNPADFKGGAAVNIKSFSGEIDAYSDTTIKNENLAASFKASRNRIPSATGRVVYSSDAIDTWTPISAPTKNIMARLISKMEA